MDEVIKRLQEIRKANRAAYTKEEKESTLNEMLDLQIAAAQAVVEMLKDKKKKRY